MSASDGSESTNTTLLRRLRDAPQDPEAWAAFVDRYGRMMVRWCRHWGLQQADAEDVTQSVMVELLRQMRQFVYDRSGSFRSWLRTVTYRAWTRFLESRNQRATREQQVPDPLDSPAAYPDFLEHFIRENDRELLEIAMERVRLRVQPQTWEAFRLTALENLAGAEVAAQLGMNVGTVFVARSKVQRMLRDEYLRINPEGSELLPEADPS
ncbi:RNA polymerase sigma factor [Tuwongella immobilis]|nr:sigma-70 family RNA polymerase sigma factor [Tuwongella immobilis]